MLPCWQLQELAEGVGDINTEAKLLLLIITSVCVKEALSGQKEQKEPGSQRQETCGPRRRLAGPWGRGAVGALPAPLPLQPAQLLGTRGAAGTSAASPPGEAAVTRQLLGRTDL